eukprot:scaffold128779_cov21-Prasinocladus_malaysianus.AAC.1
MERLISNVAKILQRCKFDRNDMSERRLKPPFHPWCAFFPGRNNQYSECEYTECQLPSRLPSNCTVHYYSYFLRGLASLLKSVAR